MKYYFTFFGLLLLIFSCRKKDNPNSGYDPTKPSFRIGTKWVYVYTAYDQNGAAVNSSEYEYKVVRDTIIGTAKYFIDSYGTHFANKADGHYFFEKNNNREVLYFKYPATVNSSYNINPAGPTCTPTLGILVLNTDTSYTYSGKKYDNLVYYLFNFTHQSCQGTPSNTKYLFSPRIGLFIYSRSANNNSSTYSTVQLKSFVY